MGTSAGARFARSTPSPGGTPGVERFCVAICHDLRGPVATAGAALERLAMLARAPRSRPRHAAPIAEDVVGPARPAGESRALLEIAQKSLARAEEMLASLPGLLAGEAACTPTIVALDEAVRSVCDEVALELRLVGGSIRVVGSMPAVLADRERLRIALRNLLRNAIAHRRSVPLEIELAAERDGDRTTLVVSDNGIGIPRAERARIFAPLYRTAGAGPGSGLGLALARHAIEACGGRIAVRPRRGPGARFAITLRAAGSDG